MLGCGDVRLVSTYMPLSGRAPEERSDGNMRGLPCGCSRSMKRKPFWVGLTQKVSDGKLGRLCVQDVKEEVVKRSLGIRSCQGYPNQLNRIASQKLDLGS